jgi:hypothetical protein
MSSNLRLTAFVSLVVLLQPAAAQGQATQVGARFGWLTYDAGGDQSYPMVQLTVEHSVAPHLRIGLLGTWSHVGSVYRPWIRPESDERVLRGIATLGYAPGRVFAGVPLLEHVHPVLTAGIGLVHSAGVETDFSQYLNDPYFGITDQSTGVTYGGGLTLEVPVASRASITGTLQIWRDRLYGGPLHNFDQVLGLAWRF